MDLKTVGLKYSCIFLISFSSRNKLEQFVHVKLLKKSLAPLRQPRTVEKAQRLDPLSWYSCAEPRRKTCDVKAPACGTPSANNSERRPFAKAGYVTWAETRKRSGPWTRPVLAKGFDVGTYRPCPYSQNSSKNSPYKQDLLTLKPRA